MIKNKFIQNLLFLQKFIIEKVFEFLLLPLNLFLSSKVKYNYQKGSVIQLAYLRELSYRNVELLKKNDVNVKYMAFGKSNLWKKADYCVTFSINPIIAVIQQYFWFWKVLAKFEIIHSHIMMMLSVSGWEIKLLKKMNRKILVHYRGCEIRDWRKNIQLHPKLNICQNCDYGRIRCDDLKAKYQRRVFDRFSDKELVTTPDLLDFVPKAEYFPFFAPEVKELELPENKDPHIVMVTNHPGIDGLYEVKEILKRLQREGLKFSYELLVRVSMERIKQSYQKADLTIGKMKMGFYANSQIESMMMGIPTVSYIRNDLERQYEIPEMLINTSLDNLKNTIRELLKNPKKLKEIRRKTRKSIIDIHKNKLLVTKIKKIYSKI